MRRDEALNLIDDLIALDHKLQRMLQVVAHAEHGRADIDTVHLAATQACVVAARDHLKFFLSGWHAASKGKPDVERRFSRY